MFTDYIRTVQVLFRDAEGLSIDEAIRDQGSAREEMRRAYEAGVSEQEACNRLLELVVKCL